MTTREKDGEKEVIKRGKSGDGGKREKEKKRRETARDVDGIIWTET